MTAVVENPRIWHDFRKVTKKIQDGGSISKEEQDLCTSTILVLMLFQNWQRPGAVVNMLASEYRLAALVLEKGREEQVISITEHKTKLNGPAHTTLEGEDVKLVRDYYNLIRPYCDPKAVASIFWH